MRTPSITAAAAALLVAIALTTSAQTSLPWPNGGFELGGASWTYPASTTFADHDDDGDQEAHFLGAGSGTWQLSIGASKTVVPATTPLSFDIEQGSLVMDFRMILLCADDPEPYYNNLGPDPDWFDDHVLSWTNGWAAASGTMVLDPVEAQGINLAGWDSMTPEERTQRLSSCFHLTLVMYGVASGFEGGATVDDFAWEL